MISYPKRFLSILLCCLIFAVPPLVNANVLTTTGKYLINVIKPFGRNVQVEATSTATGARHVIRHGVSASDLSKGIAQGVVSFAVASGLGLAFEALTGLALDAVDWVMDPANNRIKYNNKTPVQTGNFHINYAFNSPTPEKACELWSKSLGNAVMPIRTLDGFMRCLYPNGDYGPIIGGKYFSTAPAEVKYISLDTLAAKTIELADSGNAAAQKDIVDYVTDIAKKGDLDTKLDNSTDITKPEDTTCPTGYVKNSAGQCVKKDEPTTCPAGSFKVGDTCIKPPEPDEEGDSCGECCEQLLQAISALAKLQTELNQKLLDSDDKTRQELVKIQDKIDLLATDLKSINDNIVRLTYEAKKINSTLEQLDKNQELRFKNLTDTINQANKELLDSDKVTQEKLDKINEVLNKSLDEFKKTNEKLDKVNENLEKMQKCNETEFNKKMCDMADWFQQKFEKPDENGNVDIKDFELPSIDTNKVNFDNQCPAPTPLDISIPSLMINFHDELNYQPLCDFMTKLRPFVVGFGYVSGAFIVAGVGRKNG